MKLKLWGPSGPIITTEAPPLAGHIVCGFDDQYAVGVMLWSDGIETPVCSPHQAWLFDCMDELALIFGGVV